MPCFNEIKLYPIDQDKEGLIFEEIREVVNYCYILIILIVVITYISIFI